MGGVRAQCFMCSARILYGHDDQTVLRDHLRSEHSVDTGEDYLIAGFLMNQEERDAIFNVVKDRESGLEVSDEGINVAGDGETDQMESEDAVSSIEVGSVVSLADLVPETTLQECSEESLKPAEQSPPPAEEKPVVEFPCPDCSLSFKLKIKLNRHMKLHTKKEDIKTELSLSKPLVKTEKETPKRQGPRVWVPAHQNDGVPCPECFKRFRSRGPMQRHFEDIHQPGEFPCRGCGKMFTSRNKMSSHYSRHCNPNRRKLSV